jgi:uncharacterized membrane protein
MTSSARSRTDWLLPTGLILLSFIPVLASAIRIADLATAEVTSENARFFAVPVPIVVHVLSGSLFSVVGAFQFSPGFRRRHRGWHRAAGRVLVPLGLAAALSALWMTGFYQLPLHDIGLLNLFRLVFGSAMVMSLVLGALAVRRGDFAQHGAWMTRGYAIGVGAGTQAVTIAIWSLTVGEPDVLARALLHGTSWAINLAVAEWVIRRRRRRRSRRARIPARTLARSA